MENMLLRDKEILPTDEAIEKALGASFTVYQSLIQLITQPEVGLIQNWNYYNDGKAWLCKVVYKKKTIFWLSIWDQFFKTGFYFTEKHVEAISLLDIDETIKEDFYSQKSIGKLIPMVFQITEIEQLNDLLKVIAFKKSLK